MRDRDRDLHPFVERDVVTTGTVTSFHPLVCCAHKWAIGSRPTAWTKAQVKLGIQEIEDRCTVEGCEATAVRSARTGELLDYDLGVDLDAPFEEDPWRARKAAAQPTAAQAGG